MQGLADDSEITETDISYPEAGCWPDGGEGVGTDQKPEQVMMDELGQRSKREVAAIHDVFRYQVSSDMHYRGAWPMMWTLGSFGSGIILSSSTSAASSHSSIKRTGVRPDF